MPSARASAEAGVTNNQLRNFDEWERSLRNFDWLGDAVPGGMDLDFMVERKGNFLVIEGKPWWSGSGGVSVPYGQHLALYRLSRQENFRVYLVGEEGDLLHLLHYNDAPKPQVRRRAGKPEAWWPPERFIPTNRDGLRRILRGWWRDASEGE